MAVPYSIVPAVAVPLVEDSPISNIRNGSADTDLRRQILDGMAREPLSLPSLLLWNDVGLKLFKELTHDPSYYPTHKEVQVLNENADNIVKRIPSGSVLIELGCG